MQVDQYLETMIPRPTDSMVEIVRLALDVGFPSRDIVCPVTDRNANIIQASRSNLTEIVLGDPGVPVADECGVCCVVVLVLTEGIFVDNAVIARIGEKARL